MIFLNHSAYCQVDQPFIQHLSHLNLKQEHFQYLNQCTTSKDSLAYFNAKYFMQYNESELFLQTIPECVQLLKEDTNFLNYTSIYFLKDLTPNREKWFTFLKDSNFQASRYSDLFAKTEMPKLKDTLVIPEELQQDFKTYIKAFRKKPWVSATLSTIIPGLGELYIGNFQTSFTKFLSLSLFGIQSVESIVVLGIIQPLPLLNIGIFTLFYGANIVGSFRDTNKKKQDFKNQFLLHASYYYNARIKSSIY